ncbi:MAG: cobyrinate a,c-diamide synthase [Candidatus Methanomethylophilaceae archaeon]|nr:cobyrinate a,c-diamide synthase [Candidatus Methanomethylophilaceae archaeon]
MTLPRFMIAAPSSGSGKTLITCGVLQALTNRGLKVASFKCGPDYIDPMFHSRIIGAKSKNLDAFFTEGDTLRYLFSRGAEKCDISVIEGVMGFYDGIAAAETEASSHEVSLAVSAPVILVIDSKGASLSALALLKGFLEFRKNNIKGVIFNRMSERVFRKIAPEAEKMGVKAIGWVPNVKDLVLESRHLGLVLPHEVENLKDKLNRLAGILEESLDLDSVLEIANNVPDLCYKIPEVPRVGKARIGLADDRAFCFIYEDNLEILERMGAEIVRFSPLEDKHLPDVDGIILPGGYPELYLEALESNVSMRSDILKRIREGMPCLAECGGFMYLHTSITENGKKYMMCGVIEGNVSDSKKLVRFGYATFSSEKKDLWSKGHEFHYWESENCGEDWEASKPSGASYRCIHDDGTLIAGFPHMYYYSNPGFPEAFLRKCIERRDD